jgi:hypothetical protein
MAKEVVDLSEIGKAAEKITKKAGEQSLEDVYTETPRLNPDMIGKSLLDRMPEPTGWRILILPYQGKGKTEGGIYLPPETQDRCLEGWPLGLQRPRKISVRTVVRGETVGNVRPLCWFPVPDRRR